MKTSKGTIQGYNGLAAVDKKHQIIIDAQAFGSGQEQHTLQPVLETIEERYQHLDIHPKLYRSDIVVTADTGFANEANMQYLHEHQINTYIPDNKFRSRDLKFANQKSKYPHAPRVNSKAKHVIPATEFNFDPVNNTCICPAGQPLHADKTQQDIKGNLKQFFRGRKHHCHDCELKSQCMQNPDATNHPNGYGRQVSFIVSAKRSPNYTDWMKHRIDSQQGKQYYSHRMSVVDR